MLVSKWAESYWAISTVKPKTLFDYKGFYRRNLDPAFGSKDLDDLKKYEIQSFLQDLSPHTRITSDFAKIDQTTHRSCSDE